MSDKLQMGYAKGATLTKDDVADIMADILNRIAKHTKASGRTEISADDVEAVVRDVILNGL